jgi:hypothetical protein
MHLKSLYPLYVLTRPDCVHFFIFEHPIVHLLKSIGLRAFSAPKLVLYHIDYRKG